MYKFAPPLIMGYDDKEYLLDIGDDCIGSLVIVDDELIVYFKDDIVGTILGNEIYTDRAIVDGNVTSIISTEPVDKEWISKLKYRLISSKRLGVTIDNINDKYKDVIYLLFQYIIGKLYDEGKISVNHDKEAIETMRMEDALTGGI